MSTATAEAPAVRPDLPRVAHVSPTGRRLRDYQVDACEAIRDEWASGVARTAIVLATGLGKTDVIAAVATAEARVGGRVLILANRFELITQIATRCKAHDPQVAVGTIGNGRFVGRRPITVAMQQTLTRAARRRQLLRPTLVIIDECHYAASDGYLGILRWAGCLPEPGAELDGPATRLLGVTATFTRGDKRGLGDVFESVCFERGIGFGIGRRYLVEPHGMCVVGEHIALDQVRTNSKGDYRDDELGDMVTQDVEHIVTAWREHAVDEQHPDGRVTVAFTPSVASAQALAAAFRAAGVPTGEVYGDTQVGERGDAAAGTGIYGDLAAGRVRVLCSVLVPTTGWDCPPVSCVLNARPTKLLGLYTQMIGRGLRLLDPAEYPGHPVKADCLVLDVVGAGKGKTLRTLVDLHKSATYDDTEVELRPCTVCAGFLGRRTPKLVAIAAARGMAPCMCACEVCGAPGNPCDCPPEGRDPDGGRQRLRGPGRYAPLDLLAGPDSPWNWMRTPGGVDFLAARSRLGVLHRRPDGLYAAGHCSAFLDGTPGVTLIEGDQATARQAIEQWAEAEGAFPKAAAWRVARARASEQQQQVAARYGIEHPEQHTKGSLSDEIDMARAIARFDRPSS